jgi:hypothetical protein
VTKKEQGRRRVTLLDTNKSKNKRLSFLELDSFYYDRIEINFYPGKEDKLFKELKSRLAGFIGHDVCLEIKLGGFISMGEKDLGKEISKVMDGSGFESGRLEIIEEYRDIESVLEDPLYKAFKENLGNTGSDDQELQGRIDEMVIMQFSKLNTLK